VREAPDEALGDNGRMTIERIREICAQLPECEVAGDQHHKISVRGRTVGWHTVDHHGDGRVSLTVRGEKGENEQLALADPRRFFLPPYVARHGYIGMHLDLDDVDWEEVRELLLDGYRLVAPKALVTQLDAEGG
jgi:hypothetical protein